MPAVRLKSDEEPSALPRFAIMGPVKTPVQHAARVAGLLLALVGLGCPATPPPSVHRVEIGAIASREGPLPVDAVSMRPRLSRELSRTRYLRSADAPASGEALTADIWVVDTTGETATAAARELLLTVELDVPQSLRKVFKDSRLSSQVLLERSSTGPGDLERDLVFAARRAFEVLDTQVALARGDRAALQDSLGSGDAEQVALGLEWVRDHQPQVSPDTVAELLAHTDPRVVRLAVESLRLIGGQRHVPAIVEAVDLRDPDYMREVYRTLATLGGVDAAQFLEFAATNEDNPALRHEARRAFEVVLAGAPRTGGDIFSQTDDTSGDRAGGAIGPKPPIRGHR